MKRRYWIGGVLLVMMLWGMMGCGRAEAPLAGQMVDGPGMMYTPEDQSPFAGSWQSRDGTIILEVESRGQFEASGIQVFVNGEPDFASDAWVYKTGNVKLTQEHKDILMTGTFDNLTFSHAENAFRIRYSDGSGHRWLTKDGAACGEEDVIFSTESKTPLSKEWSCPTVRQRTRVNSVPTAVSGSPSAAKAAAGSRQMRRFPFTALNAATVSYDEMCQYKGKAD